MDGPSYLHDLYPHPLPNRAAGFWVMVQRLIISLVGFLALSGALPPPFSDLWGTFESEAQRVQGFKSAAVAAVIVCFTTVEIVLIGGMRS